MKGHVNIILKKFTKMSLVNGNYSGVQYVLSVSRYYYWGSHCNNGCLKFEYAMINHYSTRWKQLWPDN